MELYESTVIGIENLDGRPCYVLELVAREGVKVSYYRRKIWVDAERYLGSARSFTPVRQTPETVFYRDCRENRRALLSDDNYHGGYDTEGIQHEIGY